MRYEFGHGAGLDTKGRKRPQSRQRPDKSALFAKDAICFHSQQCAEKYLKAFLVFHGKQVPRTHNIAWLIVQCADIDSDFMELLQGDIPMLSTYAVEVRYPDFGPTSFPSLDEARQAIELAEEVRAFVRMKLGHILTY